MPPTRPIAGGNAGMNLHISEILSDIVEPIVDCCEDGNEVVSTEDMVARMEVVNDEMVDWKPGKWWNGKMDVDGMFEACGNCEGEDSYTFDVGNPKLCKCKVSNLEDGEKPMADGGELCQA